MKNIYVMLITNADARPKAGHYCDIPKNTHKGSGEKNGCEDVCEPPFFKTNSCKCLSIYGKIILYLSLLS